MKSLLSMLSFFANRAVVYVVAAILILLGIVYLYQRSIQNERTQAKADVINTVAQSTLQAVETQMQANVSASETYIIANAVTQAKAQQRHQEVLNYVQPNTTDTPYVPCPADDDFIRLYNHSGNAAPKGLP
jgi:type II secretory pathway pseudopilin PulG